MAWTDAQFDEYVEDSLNLLESLQNDLEKEYKIGHFEQWNLDQQTESLVFSNSSDPVLTCKVYALGTYGNGIWKWAWANSSLLENFSQKSKTMRKLGPMTGMAVFEDEAFKANEEMIWQIAGMALKKIGGLGVYCCPANSSDLCVVIERIARL